MKILFIRSGNRGVDPISTRQGESLEKMGHEIFYFDIIGRGLTGYLKNILRIRRSVSKNDPDIIHAHYGFSGLLASLAFTGRPVVASLMGSEVFGSPVLIKTLIRHFARHHWSGVIVKSGRMKLKMNILKAEIIPNGVDLEIFRPVDKTAARKFLGWDENVKHILFPSDPGRPEKNFPLAQEALDIVSAAYPAGDIKVHFLKDVDPSEVVYHYCASDLLVLTSRHEGSPNSVKEAMACNCPVVSTDVGDVSEIINGTAGCYIVSHDPGDISEKIISILDSGERSDGRKRVEHLDSRLIASRITDLYNRALKG